MSDTPKIRVSDKDIEAFKAATAQASAIAARFAEQMSEAVRAASRRFAEVAKSQQSDYEERA